ncbi:MAG: 3-deoxy-D-manno-octulosonic-acid transferase [Patiriisocius sp.]|jgi:3-deoxy-D-manno-octulosonic-acid transferase
MSILYNIGIYLTIGILSIAQHFSKKLKLFVRGREQTFQLLKQNIYPLDKTIWFHCASLGEFEQGVPIIEAVKKQHPNHKIVVSFFSPSGYENKKKTPLADVVVYLPMDTKRNAKKFIQAVHPSLVFFVKYEFWPEYLKELKQQEIKTLLISGVFRKDHIFFKTYGNFMRKALATFNHFFLQNQQSKEFIGEIGYTNATVSGDTRYDRVSQQIEMDNTLDFIARFKGDSLCVVCGSTWPEDEAVLIAYMNQAPKHVKFIVAPHNINAAKISVFKEKLNKQTVLYSETITEEQEDLIENAQVFIIDTIGLLTKIYSYADIAYVGGAMGTTGLHNILEPATFGIPIVIGKNYSNFPEAIRLRSLAGLFSIDSSKDCSDMLTKLVNDSNFRNKTGMICGHFINSNTGATKIVMEYLSKDKTN